MKPQHQQSNKNKVKCRVEGAQHLKSETFNPYQPGTAVSTYVLKHFSLTFSNPRTHYVTALTLTMSYLNAIDDTAHDLKLNMATSTALQSHCFKLMFQSASCSKCQLFRVSVVLTLKHFDIPLVSLSTTAWTMPRSLFFLVLLNSNLVHVNVSIQVKVRVKVTIIVIINVRYQSESQCQ